MANFRSVKTVFWTDSKIIEDFTPEDRYYYLYLLTNEKSNQIGCYELSIKQMCRDTGYNEETVKKLINRFESEHKVLVYDFKTKEVFLKNWYKYNWLNSEKTKKCIEKEFNAIKSQKLCDLISPLYAPYMTHTSNKEKEKEKENNKEKNKKNEKREIERENSNPHPPTLDEVILFGTKLGMKKEKCKKFYSYYSANNWNNVSNWQAKLEYWFMEDEEKENKNKSAVIYEEC